MRIGRPSNYIFFVAAEVVDALYDSSLDAVIGDGVLKPEVISDFKSNPDFRVIMTPPLQNRIVVLNTDKAPTDDLQVRKVRVRQCLKNARRFR